MMFMWQQMIRKYMMPAQKLGIDVIMTSTEHRTGTDRVGEVAEKIVADL